MAYENEFNDGGEAHEQGYPRSFNPHIWHTCSWYAWDAGWAQASANDPSYAVDPQVADTGVRG